MPNKGQEKTVSMTRLTIRIDFGGARRLGPGKVALLEAVVESGTISSAAKSLGMSYRRARLLIEETNALFREPVVETAHGGRLGGGARVTPFGLDVVARYRGIEASLAKAARADVKFFERNVDLS